MNTRKPADYSAMYGTLDQLMAAGLPQMELYFEIGRAVCARPEKGAAVMAAEYLQANYPGDRGPVPDRLGGHQPGGDRQPGLSPGPAEAGGTRHPLRRTRRPSAPQPRLRGVRPAYWDGQSQPPKHVPHLRRRLQRQDVPPDGICWPPGTGGGRSVVHRRLRHHLAGCAGGVPGAAG